MRYTVLLGDLFCCHGTPTSDEAYLLETVTPHGVFLVTTEEIRHQPQRYADLILPGAAQEQT